MASEAKFVVFAKSVNMNTVSIVSCTMPLHTQVLLPNHFYFVEEVLSFDFVGHMWKLVKNWLQKWIFYICVDLLKNPYHSKITLQSENHITSHSNLTYHLLLYVSQKVSPKVNPKVSLKASPVSKRPGFDAPNWPPNVSSGWNKNQWSVCRSLVVMMLAR